MPEQDETVVAVVLAGGKGTRIRRVMKDCPKPMALVDGRPFVDWLLMYLANQGVERFVISTGYLGEVFESYFAQENREIEVCCIRERSPLGTAGGFLNCVGTLSPRPDWWLVCNGDSIAVVNLSNFFDCRQDNIAGVILGVEMVEAGRYGSLDVSDSGELLGFSKKRTGKGLINAGVYLLNDRFVRTLNGMLPLSFEQDVFPKALQIGERFKVLPFKGPFLDIGTPQSLKDAGDFVKSYVAPILEEQK